MLNKLVSNSIELWFLNMSAIRPSIPGAFPDLAFDAILLTSSKVKSLFMLLFMSSILKACSLVLLEALMFSAKCS